MGADGRLDAGTLVGGRYRIEEQAGSGGNCRVYRAFEKAFERVVAVKIMRPALAEQDSERERFLKEARTCASLGHPNVLEVFEVGVHEGLPYLVMPFVAGRSLHEIQKAPMGLVPSLEILAAVADALDHAHERNVLHRDLKPENVLMSEDGRPLVADWGLARRTDERAGLTKTGIILGTPRYMSPEQILGRRLGPATDIYSLGVMLFETVTGTPPFAGEEVAALLRGHVGQDAPDTRRYRPELDGELHHLIGEMLRKEPRRRPASAGEVARRLREIIPRIPVTARTGDGSIDRSGLFEVRTQRVAGPAVGRAATTRPVYKTSRRLALPMVGLAVTMVLVALFLRRPSMPRVTAVTKDCHFALAPAKLSAPDRLVLAWRGRCRGHVELEILGQEGSQLPPMRVTKGILPRADGGWQELEIRLSRPVVEDGRIHLTLRHASEGETPITTWLDLPANECLNEFLAPLAAMDEGRLSQLVQGLDAVRSRDERGLGRHKAEIDAGISEVLETVGLSALYRHRLRAWVEKGMVGRWTADSPLSRRLLPLRCIEAILAGAPSGRVPFEGISKRLGFDCAPFSSRMKNGWPGRLAARKGFLTSIPMHHPIAPSGVMMVSRLWLMPVNVAPDGTVQRVTAKAETRDFIADRIWDLLPRGVTERVDEAMVTLDPVEGFVGAWPPRRAWLELVLMRFPRTLRLQLFVNEGEGIWICNSDNSASTSAHLIGTPVSLLVEVDPTRIVAAAARVRLRVVPYDYDPMWQAVGLRRVRLFVE